MFILKIILKKNLYCLKLIKNCTYRFILTEKIIGVNYNYC
jgi:hypothetical protein